MFAYTVKIGLIINGVSQNGARVAIAAFERSQDFHNFMKAWEAWKGECLYVTSPQGEEIWHNGGMLQRIER